MRQSHGFFSLITLLVLLAFTAAPLSIGAGGAAAEAAGAGGGEFIVQPPPDGVSAPAFILPGLDGKERSHEDLKGRVVLLHFWASWCGPCIKEFPALRKLSERFAGRGLTLLLVAEDSEKRARAFAEERGLASAVVIDRWGAVGRDYGLLVIPYSVIIGRDGRIAGVINGPRDYFSPAAIEYFEGILEER